MGHKQRNPKTNAADKTSQDFSDFLFVLNLLRQNTQRQKLRQKWASVFVYHTSDSSNKCLAITLKSLKRFCKGLL